jgi:pyridoxal phosphate enzyme (YggS family)
MLTPIQKNLALVRNEISENELRFGRKIGSVKLVAVSKGQPIASIEEAYQLNQFAFGENYLQEALPKIAAFVDKKIEWHFIGPLQSNKIKKIAEHFDWVHTVSSITMAERLQQHRPTYLPPLNICLQVNISNEKTKGGVVTNEIFTLANNCQSFSRLRLRGLMAIPALPVSFEKQRNVFHSLHIILQKLQDTHTKLDTLSMGMSNDLAAAIAEGSTMIRIGSKIFGERQ